MNREKEIFEELFVRYPALEGIREDIKSAYDVICACFDRGGKLLICGNGGSAADAQHIVGELMKGFLLKRELTDEQRQAFLEIKDGEYLANHLQGALPAVALSAHEGLNTAFANDIAADMIFAQQVWAYASSSPDALIALSTSGNSANVVNAVKVANAMGIESIGITGEKMSLMSEDVHSLPAPAGDRDIQSPGADSPRLSRPVRDGGSDIFQQVIYFERT